MLGKNQVFYCSKSNEFLLILETLIEEGEGIVISRNKRGVGVGNARHWLSAIKSEQLIFVGWLENN